MLEIKSSIRKVPSKIFISFILSYKCYRLEKTVMLKRKNKIIMKKMSKVTTTTVLNNLSDWHEKKKNYS